jgi:hypothetical protein
LRSLHGRFGSGVFASVEAESMLFRPKSATPPKAMAPPTTAPTDGTCPRSIHPSTTENTGMANKSEPPVATLVAASETFQNVQASTVLRMTNAASARSVEGAQVSNRMLKSAKGSVARPPMRQSQKTSSTGATKARTGCCKIRNTARARAAARMSRAFLSNPRPDDPVSVPAEGCKAPHCHRRAHRIQDARRRRGRGTFPG